jgi:muramoyltetrapeptide carboxypeptidase
VIRPNANIAVIAPAGVPDAADLDKGIALLGEWGFRVAEGNHLRERHRYNAGTLAARSADLVWALTDANIDVVWLARGGYGCIQCLSSLPVELPQSRVVIGCSDATALLVALSARGHSRLIHGPMVEGLVVRADDETRAWIHNLLLGFDVPSMAVQHFCGPMEDVSGPLVGGNLTVLASMAGTQYSLHSEKGIVVLEDVGEALYRLDRSVMQLRLSGALRNARAIVLGQFIRCLPPKEATYTLDEVLLDTFEPLGIPVFSTAEIGHGARNRGWRYGGGVTIQNGAMQFDVIST